MPSVEPLELLRCLLKVFIIDEVVHHQPRSLNGEPMAMNVMRKKAHAVQQLHECVAELESALEKQQRRADLLQQELSHLRASGGSHREQGRGLPISWQQDQHHDVKEHAVNGRTTTRSQLPTWHARRLLSGHQWAQGDHQTDGNHLEHEAHSQGPAAKHYRHMMVAAGTHQAQQISSQANAEPLSQNKDTVTLSRQAYELLQLKDRAMDSVKEGITIADCTLPDMPLIYANRSFSSITGYATADVMGRNCRFLQGEATEESEVDQMRYAMQAGQPCVVQLMNYKRNGDAFVNYLSMTPIHDKHGLLTHYVGIQSDITDFMTSKTAELSAKHAAAEAQAATEAKSQFLARMSHEIRTPLNGMIAVGQLLAETPMSPAQWDLVNTIRCSGETLVTLITDILDFSRLEASKMLISRTEYRLQTVIEAAMEIAGLHAAQKRLQVAYHVTDQVPRLVIGDAQRLQQILLNVLNNAVKFTKQGEILLEPAVDAAGPEGIIHFAVHDSGIGISLADLRQLFQPFSQLDASITRRYGGSGLGLTISQKLSEAMGGRMWAESDG
eukprot:jgi/Astpho2/8558/Aster-05592